nr:MAG TPA: hypothetical protein [Caudoviricetes sp.]
MSQPTREEIIRAYQTLNHLCDCLEVGCTFGPATIKASKNAIEKALLPKPKRTMAEIQWDNEEHYLAEAETENGIKVVMLSQDENVIKCIQPPNAGDVVIGLPKKDLTPTGRYYTPTQTQED